MKYHIYDGSSNINILNCITAIEEVKELGISSLQCDDIYCAAIVHPNSLPENFDGTIFKPYDSRALYKVKSGWYYEKNEIIGRDKFILHTRHLTSPDGIVRGDRWCHILFSKEPFANVEYFGHVIEG